MVSNSTIKLAKILSYTINYEKTIRDNFLIDKVLAKNMLAKIVK